jgi:manganese-dependent inorganic pyrophosphatase
VPDPILVIGHRRPDLDSVASALAYAALLREMGRPATAARAGPLDGQSEWALRRFGVSAPALVQDVAPTFASIAEPIATLPEDATLAAVIERIGTTGRAVPIVDGRGRPCALVDAVVAVRMLGLAGARVGAPGSEAAIRAGAARSAAPVLAGGEVAHERLRLFGAGERLSDRAREILRVGPDDLLVVDADGAYRGLARRVAVSAPPRARLVLVDHNEVGQAVPGADQAELVEVIDHHRLGAPPTATPISFTIDVVGCTATLVEERWRARAIPVPGPLAGVLLCAVISDTLAFKSPTTVERDRASARRLAQHAGVEDVGRLGEELLASGAGLTGRTGDEIAAEDFKEYDPPAGHILVSQAEVQTLNEVAPRLGDLSAALERLREKRAAVLAALLITDVVRGTSRLLACGEPRLVARIPYPHAADGTFDAGNVVSRKKQLVPALLAALE